MAFPRTIRRRVAGEVAEETCGQTYGPAEVAASTDDAWESVAGGMNLTGTTHLVDNVDEWFGHRWDGVIVPAGATIESCSIDLFFYSASLDEPNHPMFFELADDPGTFTTGANDISNRSRTSSVTWTNADLGAPGYFTSPDLTTPLQEVIDRPGWGSGQALVCVIRGAAANRDMGLEMWNHPNQRAAIINIQFCA